MRRGPVLIATAAWLASGAGPAFAGHRRVAPTCPDGACDIPWAWDDNGVPPAEEPPYPHGFALTVPVPPRPQPVAARNAINRYTEVAEAIGRCWDPSAAVGNRHWGAITVRVSFKRDGSVYGVPRITYVDPLADKSAAADLRASLLQALARCAPLPFTPALGSAIAGEVFTIRFIQKGLAI